MQFSKKTIFGFFDGTRKSFVIPVYQRAYAWTEKEWQTFLTDLTEQIQGNSSYFFGNVLLETVEPDRVFEVIDGQQRLTTLTIFFRALINVLTERSGKGEETGISVQEKVSVYLKNSGVIKLRPVEYDRACYDALIIENKERFPMSSPSQRNMSEARDWFIKQLRQFPTADIVKILSKIESTEITSIEFSGKKEAALMFELQNNRGKDLTNMERLKSYFMYQLYVYSEAGHAETNIEYIANLFKRIYILINDIGEPEEDSILNYHCQAYLKGFDYRNIDEIKTEFKKADQKVSWINSFVEELHTTFSSMKDLGKCRDRYYLLIQKLKTPSFVYPFLIRGYRYHANIPVELGELFKIMETLVFRHAVIRSGATINSRLNSILSQYNGNAGDLRAALKEKLNKEHHWSDDRLKTTLDGYMYSTPIVNYLLWGYEASIQTAGYVVGALTLEDEQIEHISPQTPPEGPRPSAGYEVDGEGTYTEEFIRDYLNCLGNLVLISGKHNRKIGNIPFKEKLNSYMGNPLVNQQGEIRKFFSGDQENPVWDMEAIDKRHAVIVEFAMSRWRL